MTFANDFVDVHKDEVRYVGMNRGFSFFTKLGIFPFPKRGNSEKDHQST